MKQRQQAAAPKGVSFVVCCFNSASRLPYAFAQTLEHLAALHSGHDSVRWEVIVVDNASTDDTGNFARDHWPAQSAAPFRIIREPRPGLGYARERGLSEARYDLVTFVDDDNWLDPNWIDVLVKVMDEHPEAGACGSLAEAVCEEPPPWWFDEFKDGFAVGPEWESADVTDYPGMVWGAGLTIRKEAWLNLRQCGFRARVPDRQGEILTEGGDTELCAVLRLAGWRLRFDRRLRLRHFLPAERVRWDHLRARHRAGGASSVDLDPYVFALRRARRSNLRLVPAKFERDWRWQIAREFVRISVRRPSALVMFRFERAGNRSALAAEYSLGRMKKLFELGSEYNAMMRAAPLRVSGPAVQSEFQPGCREPGPDRALS